MSRYRLLMTRGLTLIRVHFVGGLREIASDVSKRIADKQLNDTTNSALLYAKFRFGASELKEVAQEIRKRAILPVDAEPGAEGEYQSLMNELYTSYSATRGKLVIPLARKNSKTLPWRPVRQKTSLRLHEVALDTPEAFALTSMSSGENGLKEMMGSMIS